MDSNCNNPYYEITSPGVVPYAEYGHTPSRPDIIKYLVMNHCPQYILNEDYNEQVEFLRKTYNCICNDCNGPSTTADCKVEEFYLRCVPKHRPLTNVVFL